MVLNYIKIYILILIIFIKYNRDHFEQEYPNKKINNVAHLENLINDSLTFAQLIHSVRLSNQISQVKLARMMNIPRSYLCDIENGCRFVSLKKAKMFAQVLDCPETYFIASVITDQLRPAGMPYSVELKLTS